LHDRGVADRLHAAIDGVADELDRARVLVVLVVHVLERRDDRVRAHTQVLVDEGETQIAHVDRPGCCLDLRHPTRSYSGTDTRSDRSGGRSTVAGAESSLPSRTSRCATAAATDAAIGRSADSGWCRFWRTSRSTWAIASTPMRR